MGFAYCRSQMGPWSRHSPLMLATERDDGSHGVRDHAATVTICDRGIGLFVVGMDEEFTMRHQNGGNRVSADLSTSSPSARPRQWLSVSRRTASSSSP